MRDVFVCSSVFASDAFGILNLGSASFRNPARVTTLYTKRSTVCVGGEETKPLGISFFKLHVTSVVVRISYVCYCSATGNVPERLSIDSRRALTRKVGACSIREVIQLEVPRLRPDIPHLEQGTRRKLVLHTKIILINHGVLVAVEK